MESDLEEFLEQYQRTVEAVVKGDSSPQERLWSRNDDVTLASPFGPPARGWTEVSDALRRAASQLSDGELLGGGADLGVFQRRSRLRPRDRAIPREGGRDPGAGALVASRDHDPQTRRGRLESSSSSRRPDHDATAD